MQQTTQTEMVYQILSTIALCGESNQEDSDGDGVGDVTDDADHDGVWNPNDICNDTPLNTKVNIEGCPVSISLQIISTSLQQKNV